jgi:hypothetical protein
VEKHVSENLVFSFLGSSKILKFSLPALHKLEPGFLLVIILRGKDFSGSSFFLLLYFSFFLVSEFLFFGEFFGSLLIGFC